MLPILGLLGAFWRRFCAGRPVGGGRGGNRGWADRGAVRVAGEEFKRVPEPSAT